MRVVMLALGLALLTCCSSQQYPIVTRCEAPAGSEPVAHVIFLDGRVVSAHEVTIPPGCYINAEDKTPRLTGGDGANCGGVDFTGWTVLQQSVENGGTSFRTVVQSADTIHLMQSSTSGGMPSGALEINQWLILIAPSDKPVEPCNTHTRFKPYSGPMPA